MKLFIDFQRNLTNLSLIRQNNIPCICRISDQFELSFGLPLDEISGVVSEWSRDLLEERAPAGGGGKWTHHRICLASLRELSTGEYEIIDLKIFYETFGWIDVLHQGLYAPPIQIWDEE